MKHPLVLNLLVALFLSIGIKSYGTRTWVSVTSGASRPASLQTKSSVNGCVMIDASISGFYTNPVSINGAEYLVVSLPGSYPSLEAGNPGLPYLNATVNIPANGRFSTRIIESEYVEYHNMRIAPSRGNLPLTAEAAATPYTFGESYDHDDFYPGNLAGGQETFIIRNQRGQSFSINSFQYNPVTRTLRVYTKLSVEIYLSETQGENELSGDDLNISNVREITASVQPAFLNNQTRSDGLPDENGQMLIICPGNFSASLKPFTDWKNATGIATHVVDAGSFKTPEELRDFVRDYYYAAGNLAYLLLVGDAEQIPPYIKDDIISDNYYGYLAGDDHYPEVLVGRFSAENINELNTQIDRTLEYEKGLGNNRNYYSTATGIASEMKMGDDGESDFQHTRNLLSTLKDFTYTDFAELYDGSQGGLDADGYPTSQMAIDQINQGTGLILYTGHGGINTWITAQVSSSVVDMLGNNGSYPFIWSVACETGNFKGHTCLAESWLRATDNNGKPAGAVAALMASGVQTTMPPMEAQDKMVDYLAHCSEQGSPRTFGGLSASGMISMNSAYGKYGYAISDTWILFGDPSLAVRTNAPEPILASHKSYIAEGGVVFNVSANVSGGLATLSQDGELLGSGTISQGKAQIILQSPASGSSILLTITSFNRTPYTSDILVRNKPSDATAVTPVNHSRLIPVDPVFEWNAGDGAQPDGFRLFLGTNNPPSNIINGFDRKDSSFNPNLHLDYNTTYYWRVESYNANGSSYGVVNEFKTVFQPDEDFETGQFKSTSAWVNEGGSWTIDNRDAFDGDFCGRSGIITDNGYSSLKYSCNVNSCDFVSFWRKTSTEENKDKLCFYIDGQLTGEWSGESEWKHEIFHVTAGFHELEWRYSKDAGNGSGEDAVWLDDIHLPVHGSFEAGTTPLGTVCAGSPFVPEASASNYSSITWQTTGDGTFDDCNLLIPQYSPGPLDLSTGSFLLTMQADGYNGCSSYTGMVVGNINPTPEIMLPEDTLASAGGSIVLDGSCESGIAYEWIQTGTTLPYITVNESDAADGKISLTLKVTNEYGCSSEQTTTVHFVKPGDKPSFSVYPNPCTDYFTLQPENGLMALNHLYVVDARGTIRWQQNSDLTINGSSTFNLPQLASGLYMVVAESEAGAVTRPILINP
ncbi:MAG TPA: C25 family cysteine peptidase [Bacteroidales bacterium]|nr:C25 family cysteine peptidase [Bacteroidales bacterium]HPT02332.1 C25 family cysteine peptidase [Bacteroidales bacterium]